MTVKQLREQNRWSQVDLQHRSGIRQATISAVENGVLPLWPKYRQRFSEAFGIDPNDLTA